MLRVGLRCPEDATLPHGQRIQVISRINPLRLLMTSPSSLNCRLAKWPILLSQYEMQFMPQKVIKGQAVVDFLADHPVLRTSKLYNNLPTEIAEVNVINTSSEEQCGNYSLTAHQGRTLREISSRVWGVVLISPHNYVIHRAVSLTEPCSNNVSEYNALLIGYN